MLRSGRKSSRPSQSQSSAQPRAKRRRGSASAVPLPPLPSPCLLSNPGLLDPLLHSDILSVRDRVSLLCLSHSIRSAASSGDCSALVNFLRRSSSLSFSYWLTLRPSQRALYTRLRHSWRCAQYQHRFDFDLDMPPNTPIHSLMVDFKDGLIHDFALFDGTFLAHTDRSVMEQLEIRNAMPGYPPEISCHILQFASSLRELHLYKVNLTHPNTDHQRNHQNDIYTWANALSLLSPTLERVQWTQVTMDQPFITQHLSKLLHNWKHLTSLTLERCFDSMSDDIYYDLIELTAEAIHHGLLQNTTLTEFGFIEQSTTDQCLNEWIELFHQNPLIPMKLKRLQLNGFIHITTSTIQQFLSIFHNTNSSLQYLHLNCLLPNDIAQGQGQGNWSGLIDSIIKLSTLESLTWTVILEYIHHLQPLSFQSIEQQIKRISPHYLTTFGRLWCHPSLVHLNIALFKTNGMQFLDQPEFWHCFRSAEATSTDLSQSLQSQQAFALAPLRTLRLRECHLTQLSTTLPSMLSHSFSRLECLDLGDCLMPESAAELWGQYIAESPRLTKVILAFQEHQGGFEKLSAPLSRCRHLDSLTLTLHPISVNNSDPISSHYWNSHLQLLAVIPSLNLQFWNFRLCHINESAAVALGEAIRRIDTVTELTIDFSHACLHWSPIANALAANRTIRSLTLCGLWMDADMALLESTLKDHPTIRHRTLVGVDFTTTQRARRQLYDTWHNTKDVKTIREIRGRNRNRTEELDDNEENEPLFDWDGAFEEEFSDDSDDE